GLLQHALRDPADEQPRHSCGRQYEGLADDVQPHRVLKRLEIFGTEIDLERERSRNATGDREQPPDDLPEGRSAPDSSPQVRNVLVWKPEIDDGHEPGAD